MIKQKSSQVHVQHSLEQSSAWACSADESDWALWWKIAPDDPLMHFFPSGKDLQFYLFD